MLPHDNTCDMYIIEARDRRNLSQDAWFFTGFDPLTAFDAAVKVANLNSADPELAYRACLIRGGVR